MCTIPDCDRPLRAKGLCGLHYDRQRRAKGGDWDRSPDPLYDLDASTKNCTVEDCDRPVRCVGLCSAHYRRSRDTEPCACGGVKWKDRDRCWNCRTSDRDFRGVERQCSACLVIKPEGAFPARYWKGRAKVGTQCRDCTSARRNCVSDLVLIGTYGTDCHLCGEPIDLLAPRNIGAPGWERSLHREHVQAVTRGGAITDLENIRPAHGLCNMRKSNRV